MASHFASQDNPKNKAGRQGAPASRYAEPPQRGLSTGKKVGIAFAVVLAVLLVIVGSFKDLTFMLIVFANTAIGIIQEIREGIYGLIGRCGVN